ncbi:YbcC family protein [Rhizobium oryziradicis]|uniref:Probable inorganic carbon transporter subunit DabA n=1 Tax=Rhizobium oryziradicis TaxID=1867956 RepID=A0A1Q8ZW73_9HYPH|nr:hypothetical protein BJF95_03910 [Rhizobium oryziradicis]
MNKMIKIDTLHGDALAQAADQAVRAIPPAWPLTATVAVNPFFGQAQASFEETAALLARIGGVRLALPRKHYADRITKGEIIDVDLVAALNNSTLAGQLDLADLKAAAQQEPPAPLVLPTIADLAAHASGKDWPGLVAERIGTFAAGFFDQGQALWAASRHNGLYAAWRAFAIHDLTPEILGLEGFGLSVASTPETAQGLIERAAKRLGFGAEPGTYFHQLLLTLGGWAHYARHLQWKAELDGGSDQTALELLAIRLVFEEALYERYQAAMAGQWRSVRNAHLAPMIVDEQVQIDAVLQSAAERAAQRALAEKLSTSSPVQLTDQRPLLHAAFCIDVRSEVFRRALESIDPGIQTAGFAGFFGLGTSHKGLASDVSENRLPVLLKPSVFTCSAVESEDKSDQQTRFAARAVRAWGRFKLAAVSSFAFVEAMGPVYAAKLLKDGLGLAKGHKPDAPAPRFGAEIDLERRITMAETVLRAMSLTDNFARVVLLCGHGANVVNNPYASALHCGACGGYAGDVNARLLAGLLNEAAVRTALAEKGIVIPADTTFIAALHDTTTDAVTLFDGDLSSKDDLAPIRNWLEQAGRLARTERAQRLPRATASSIFERSRDWAEVRPEFGLAGCRAFIAAPRSRTRGRNLEGQAFLHDYAWQQDEGFKVLELILTAPVVVASWISLQYFGSAVAPDLFGAGNKLLHNVVGGIGVVEGNGGTLRTGLPWQSVHDGEAFVHEPLRLTVAVEAPKEAISDILQRHAHVRALFDNGWLSLFTLDPFGCIAWRYQPGHGWLQCAPSE